MVRNFLAVMAGVMTTGLVVFLIESIGHFWFFPKTPIDINDRAAMTAFVSSLPVAAFLLVLLAYVAGTVAGGWVACQLAKKRAGLFTSMIGGFVLLAAAANMLAIPHPLWFMLTVALSIPLTVFLTYRLASTRQPS